MNPHATTNQQYLESFSGFVLKQFGRLLCRELSSRATSADAMMGMSSDRWAMPIANRKKTADGIEMCPL